MKRIGLWFLACSLFSLSQISFADKFLLDDKAVPLVADGNHYSFPSTYIRLDELYHFVIVGSVKRVCFLNEKPEFASLDMLSLLLEIRGVELTWYCYAYSPEFFAMDF